MKSKLVSMLVDDYESSKSVMERNQVTGAAQKILTDDEYLVYLDCCIGFHSRCLESLALELNAVKK